MTQRPDVPRGPVPLRAEPRADTPAGRTMPPGLPPAAPATAVSAPAGTILASTLKAGGVALAILGLVYLPAEYGVDPTGLGAVLGLTEMGEIKQSLRAEATADEVAQAAAFEAEVAERLDRIEASLAALAAAGPLPSQVAVAAPPAAAMPAPAPAPTTESAPQPEAAPQPATDPAAEAAAQPPVAPEPAWRDSYEVTLAPGEGIEVKLAMEEGQTATFAWAVEGGVVNHDTHGDGAGQSVTYEEGRAVPSQEGTLTAAFTGNHGWFWRNRGDAPVTLTLVTGGEYQEMRRP